MTLYACGAHDSGHMLLAALYTDGLSKLMDIILVSRFSQIVQIFFERIEYRHIV